MTSRELRNVQTERVLGLVLYANGRLSFEGGADAIFRRMVSMHGERVVGEELMANGWSNGYLYLAPARSS